MAKNVQGGDLEATHSSVSEFIDRETLQAHAWNG
jgi:hypothetical protein